MTINFVYDLYCSQKKKKLRPLRIHFKNCFFRWRNSYLSSCHSVEGHIRNKRSSKKTKQISLMSVVGGETMPFLVWLHELFSLSKFTLQYQKCWLDISQVLLPHYFCPLNVCLWEFFQGAAVWSNLKYVEVF